jgi:DNA-binding MarR family transcriptional regulator
MESLVQELKKLNLSDKEARVYLALLELGPSSPYKIAKHSRLKRPTAYVIAEELVEKGLIVQMTGEKQRMYIAKSPETYVEEVERRVKDARRIVPELLALQRKKSEKPNVLYFEGIEGMKKAYEYRIKDFKNKEIVGFFARANEVDQEYTDEVFIPWNENRTKYDISVRGFTVDDEKLTKDYARFMTKGDDYGSGLIRGKFLPEKLYSSDCSIESFEFGVRICIMKSKQVLVIESEEVALAIKQVMELLWQKTKGEYDEPERLSFKAIKE